MSARISIAVLTFGLALAHPVVASDVGYIYGRVETEAGDTYQGQIRWGTEESFWDDIFNANKVRNENLDLVDHGALRRLRARHWSGWDVFGDRDADLTHLFAVRFGD